MICQNRSLDDIYFTLLLLQAVCTYGRENFESWGRKKRDVSSLTKRAVDNSADNAMSLSREIIVLDFGDEATNPYDFDKATQGQEHSAGNSKLFQQVISQQQHSNCDDSLQRRTSNWTPCHGLGGVRRCSAPRWRRLTPAPPGPVCWPCPWCAPSSWSSTSAQCSISVWEKLSYKTRRCDKLFSCFSPYSLLTMSFQESHLRNSSIFRG